MLPVDNLILKVSNNVNTYMRMKYWVVGFSDLQEGSLCLPRSTVRSKVLAPESPRRTHFPPYFRQKKLMFRNTAPHALKVQNLLCSKTVTRPWLLSFVPATT
jgi:hypothetical protein